MPTLRAMSDPIRPEHSPDDEYWRSFLTTGKSEFEQRFRRIFGHLPTHPRCKACNAPFKGIGAPIVSILFGRSQSYTDPRFCEPCVQMARKHPGGAEIEITMLFADIRGSTTVAEDLSPAEFGRTVNRFYKAATDVLLETDAFIYRLIGDEVVGIYFEGLAGAEHARKGLEAAREILKVTGHADADGPWIPVGAGLHTGVSYVGVVGSTEGAIDITALGDVPNVAARLASLAAPGEIILSEATRSAAGLDLPGIEKRSRSLKGRREAVETYTIYIGDGGEATEKKTET
ncbi:MAG: adenylate/guanylate cyclase domain-containing protein [Anaerolineales bacterium]